MSTAAEQLAQCVEDLNLWLSAFEMAPLDRLVLRRAAGPFSTPIGTLDAIHLATAQLWMERRNQELTLLTHDRQLAIAADLENGYMTPRAARAAYGAAIADSTDRRDRWDG